MDYLWVTYGRYFDVGDEQMSNPRTDNAWDKEAWERGVEFERERIIKLLDAEFERVFLIKDYPASNAIANVRAALIKGENK